jgi:hypothetical protein
MEVNNVQCLWIRLVVYICFYFIIFKKMNSIYKRAMYTESKRTELRLYKTS